MQSNSPVPNFNYSLSGGGNSTTPMLTVLKTIDPTIYDIQYSVKQRWLNTVESREWILTGFICNSGVTTANWLQISDGDALVDFAVPNGTSPISPDTNGLVNFTQSGQITITGSAGGTGAQNINFDVSAVSQIGGLLGTTPILPDVNGLINYTSTDTSLSITGSAGGLGAQNIDFSVNQPVLMPWAPTLFGASTAGTTTYSERTGTYKVWGGVVFAQFAVIGSTNGGSGDVIIGGLPMANNSQTNCYGSCIDTNFNWPVGTSSISLQLSQGNTFMRIIASGSGAVFNFVQISDTSFNVQGSIFYSI